MIVRIGPTGLKEIAKGTALETGPPPASSLAPKGRQESPKGIALEPGAIGFAGRRSGLCVLCVYSASSA